MVNQVSSQLTQFYYTAQHKPNQLIYGSGQTAVITGWMVKQAVAKHLQSNEYAVIGQLYSPTRGINLLIRNLLLNPHVHYLVILNATKEDKNAGACQCLGDFFRHGVEENISDAGRKSWVIRSQIPGYIDIDIDINALEKLRHSVEIQDAISISDAVEKIQYYAQKEIVAPWGTPLQFAMNVVESNVFPGTRYGHRIEGKTIAETWVKIIHRIKTTGTIRPTGYDGKWQELIDLMAVVTEEPDDFYFPEPNYLPIDRSFLEEYISQILDDAPNREGVKYTYGQRLRSWFGRDQIEKVIDKLANDIDSARAVMSLWDASQDDNDNPPCLNHIWVRIVDNELSLTATFRSNDMFSAWPANAMGLRALQKYIYDSLINKTDHILKMGALITMSQSAHIYDDCFENVANVISSQYSKIAQRKDYFDPAGSFIITIQDGSIIVEHTTPGSGEVVNCYCGKSAHKLSQQIFTDCPGLQVSHAMYLGVELQKAEMALLMKEQFIYEQDKFLGKLKLQ
ncbi:thymidylate synthase [Dolichospermum sp. UHCC 0352]|nr:MULTISPECIES: thymidylate synthase [unclassified Dolichospermum]MTJ16745.1 thymidylate synthase [Dolichospermum sp. UHCC 0299]MTJ21956.1 thymidylate synthase [Dolichospermum sp. UHCC 0352]MTJ39571.1 thymidylate synthase [Dolichospermum sp. UHCC 0406]